MGQTSSKHLASIEFFGYKGLDTEAIRAAIPIREGDAFPGRRSNRIWSRLVTDAVVKMIGKTPTDIRFVCCTQDGSFTLYVGLPGSTFAPLAYGPTPGGKNRLPKRIVLLYEQAGKAGYEAIMKGNSGEDRSQGYSLFLEPKAREIQLRFREEVLRNEEAVFAVLDNSFSHDERAIAAEALGYTQRSDRQIEALVKASLDPDEEVRNNAVRALGVMITAFPEVGAKLPLKPYLSLVSSGSWADHNKASLLLERLTAARRRETLENVRNSPALDSLIEMAQWRNAGHAYFAITALGRIAGIDEAALEQTISRQQLNSIINALR
jgi:HEAT repeats